MFIYFGKYKGKDIEEIPSDYLKYLIEKGFEEDIRIAAEEEYEFRTKWKTHFFDKD
jgi:hypothetical protein